MSKMSQPANTRRSSNIQLVYVADGFADDWDEFIHRCSRYQKLTYERFVEVWKEMDFANIYAGRTCGAEIAELSEELLHITKHYMIADTSNFEENVAGVFLLYGLLNLQPYSGFAPLRLVPDDMAAIRRLESVARRDRRLDVLYCLGSILVQGPVEYHADSRERGMEGALRKYLEGNCTGIDLLGVRPKGVFLRQNSELDSMRDLQNYYKKYKTIKPRLKRHSANGDLDRNLNYFDLSMMEKLESSLKAIINGTMEIDISNDEAVDTTDKDGSKQHYNSVQAIKQRAMKTTVDTLKHRTGVDEKMKNSKSLKPEIRTNYGKVKSGSPKKPLATNTPRSPKYSPTIKQKTNRRKLKKEINSSSDSDSDISLKIDDDDDDDVVSDDEVQNFTRFITSLSKDENTQKQYEVDLDNTLVVQEIGVELEVPIYIRTEDNQFEIEVIDKLHNCRDARPIIKELFATTNEKNKNSKKCNIESKLKSLPDVSLKKIDEEFDSISNGSIEEAAVLSEMTCGSTFGSPKLLNATLDQQTYNNTSKVKNNVDSSEEVCETNSKVATFSIAKITKQKSPEKSSRNRTKSGSSVDINLEPSSSNKIVKSGLKDMNISPTQAQNTNSFNLSRNIDAMLDIIAGDPAARMVEEDLLAKGRSKRVKWSNESHDVGNYSKGSIANRNLNVFEVMTSKFDNTTVLNTTKEIEQILLTATSVIKEKESTNNSNSTDQSVPLITEETKSGTKPKNCGRTSKSASKTPEVSPKRRRLPRSCNNNTPTDTGGKNTKKRLETNNDQAEPRNPVEASTKVRVTRSNTREVTEKTCENVDLGVPQLKKTEKRFQKKRVLRTRFKKMGIMEIADFD